MKTEQWQWSQDKGWSSEPSSETASLGASAQVVFLFGSVDDIEAGQCFNMVKTTYPNAHLFGCTTAGVIHGTNVTDKGVTITAIAFEDTRVATTHVQIPDIDHSFEAGVRLAQSLDANGLRHVFVLSEGIQVSTTALIHGINSALPDTITVSGGFAGDGNRFQQTYVWCDGPPQQSAVIALAFYGDRLQVGTGSSAGWQPFGTDRLITRSKGNVLYEIDDRPALALYKQYLGDYAQNLPSSGLLFPLALRVGDGEKHVLRALLAINEEEQSITFAGDVPEHSYARLMRGQIEQIIEGAQVAATASTEHLSLSAPLFSLLVSCNGRRAVLKQRIEDEIEVVHDALGNQSTLTGFYSYGEIAPAIGGGPSELHNETMTITSFTES